MGWDKEAKVVSSEGLNNKYPVDLELEESISSALKEGRKLNDKEKNFIYDKLDFYKYAAEKAEVPYTNEKLLDLFQYGYYKLDGEELKKALDYKNRDGSELSKGRQAFLYGEGAWVMANIYKEGMAHIKDPEVLKCVDDVMKLSRDYYEREKEAIINMPQGEHHGEKRGANPSEVFEDIMSKNEPQEKSKGRGM